MSRRVGGVGRRRGGWRPRLAIGLGVLALLAPARARAGPIWRQWTHPGLVVRARAVDPWERYYQAALRYHWTNVRVPLVVVRSLRPGADGLLPRSSLVEYLEWRHGLNPARFDRYHPFLGPLLERDSWLRSLIPPTTLTVVPPTRQTGIDSLVIPPPTSPPDTQSPELLIPPPQVPEPATLWIGLALAGIAARYRAGRRA